MNYIITALVLIAYERNLFFQLKPLFGIDKIDYKKPFDCFYCLSFWFNTLAIIGLHIYLWISKGQLTYCYSELIGWGFCILITKIIDLLWNK